MVRRRDYGIVWARGEEYELFPSERNSLVNPIGWLDWGVRLLVSGCQETSAHSVKFWLRPDSPA